MRDQGYGELMRKAVSASDDTTEVRDEEGRVARIARDESYPGAICVTLDATEDQTRYQTKWILPATESRPSFYPDRVPFVSGISCVVTQASKTVFINSLPAVRQGDKVFEACGDRTGPRFGAHRRLA